MRIRMACLFVFWGGGSTALRSTRSLIWSFFLVCLGCSILLCTQDYRIFFGKQHRSREKSLFHHCFASTLQRARRFFCSVFWLRAAMCLLKEIIITNLFVRTYTRFSFASTLFNPSHNDFSSRWIILVPSLPTQTPKRPHPTIQRSNQPILDPTMSFRRSRPFWYPARRGTPPPPPPV